MPQIQKPERDENCTPLVFDALALGSSLRRLAVDVVRGEDTDFMSRWFRSVMGDADLVIWTDSEKRIIKYQLCFYGQVVDWNPIKGTRTGLIVEEELDQSVEAGGNLVGNINQETDEANVAETIRFDRTVQNSVVQQAIQVLACVPDLDEPDRENLIFNLRESPRLHKKARERALKAWAPKADELTSTRRPTFWRRLRSWVLGA
jgi:hypothetical protein